MRRTSGRPGRPHRGGAAPFLDPLTTSLAVAFFLGLLAGALTVPAMRQHSGDLFFGSCMRLVQTAVSNQLWHMAVSAFLLPLFLLLCLLLSAFSGVGIPFCYGIVAVYGFGSGLVGGYLYSAYSGSGVLFNLLMLLPATVLTAVAMICFARLCTSCAYLVCKDLFLGEKQELAGRFKKLRGSVLVAGGLCLLAAGVKVLCFLIFSAHIQV